MSAFQSLLAADGKDERQKDAAGERMWRLACGESWGGTFGPVPEEPGS
jgi:hypothetical protein